MHFNKKILFIVIPLILIILVVAILFLNKNNLIHTGEPVPNDLTYDQAYELAKSLYERDDTFVELEEQETEYIIYVKLKDSQLLVGNFSMNKEDGSITDLGLSIPG